MQHLPAYRTLFAGLGCLLSLLAARMLWHGNLHFAFLAWNLLLAVLPVFFAHGAIHSHRRAYKWIYAVLWLIFFPNAAYLLTDIVHLQVRDGAAFWLDLVLLFSAGLYGVVLGLRSLRMMESWYGSLLSPVLTNALTLLLLFANGYGIYLGRIERWNSWDLVCNTGDLLQSIVYEFRHPVRCIEVWSLSGVFAAGLGLGYFALCRRLSPGERQS